MKRFLKTEKRSSSYRKNCGRKYAEMPVKKEKKKGKKEKKRKGKKKKRKKKEMDLGLFLLQRTLKFTSLA